MTFQSLPRFLELPKELQIQVWRCAIETADEKANFGHVFNYNDHGLNYDDPNFDENEFHSVPILEGPYSSRRLCYYHAGSRRRILMEIMSSCQLSRLLSLEYWHGQVKDLFPRGVTTTTPEATFSKKGAYVLGVLEECIEQVRHAMRAEKLKARS